MFWNVENFFEARPHFKDKCNGIAKTVMLAADDFGMMPDLIGLAEVENRRVVQKLVSRTGLRRADYGIVHYDSPDHRGIDCALLYRRSRFRLVFSKPCHLTDSSGRLLPTRDILLVVLEPSEAASVAVLVNHHPSKVGKGSDGRRELAMARLLALRDSLMEEGIRRIVAIGDFNDEVIPAEGVVPAYPKGAGTIKFQGKWEKIDGCPVLEGLEAREHIFAPPHLSTRDTRFSGTKPLRTFSGPRYLGGLSDHYPIVLEIREK
jgi:endonuclease/exonuclease/phosphatase family metal-dependent hydrolase